MISKLPDPLRELVDQLSELPSVGPRHALRLAFYLVGRGGETIERLAHGLEGLKSIKPCERCYFVHQNENNLCDICGNPARDPGVMMVVEKETDLISLENTGKFRGRYFIMGPIPKIGVLEDWQKARLETLKNFIKNELQGQAAEIILAFNPTSVGDFNATLITKELTGLTQKITRLGRGLPTGGEIEFADDETLGSALERRT